jgi:polyisoprenoid-binding protein YceI
MIRKIAALALVAAISMPVSADDHGENSNGSLERYVIDTRGAHAFVQFKISHLGFSWLYGRFNEFEGEFHSTPRTRPTPASKSPSRPPAWTPTTSVATITCATRIS